MKYCVSFGLLFLLILFGSCRKDFGSNLSSGELSFSKDTVFLDTVFTNISSATYKLKVYNNRKNAITIPSIKLKNGINSYYRLNIDGIAGKEFENVTILAKDSMYIFVETTIDAHKLKNPLYTDKILFDKGVNEQNVDLVTLVQDATFIYPNRNPISLEIEQLKLDGKTTKIKGRFLDNHELIFKKDKSYVIYGYAAVPNGKILNIQAGSNVYFHKNSGLIVDNNAKLVVNGTLKNKVIFEGDRLEHLYNNVPGQWGSIWLRKGSETITNHLKVKNSSIGFLVEGKNEFNTPSLTIKNTEIYNSSLFGILAQGTYIKGENIVIGNTGRASLAGTEGGNYEFTHCTFANHWQASSREYPCVSFNNFFSYINENKKEVIEPRNLDKLLLTNCIIDGNKDIEFILERIDGGNFNYQITNSFIQFNDINNEFKTPELDFNSDNYSGIFLNKFLDFKNTDLNDFNIGEKSEAINKAINTSITKDLNGTNRLPKPDVGAYQHIISE